MRRTSSLAGTTALLATCLTFGLFAISAGPSRWDIYIHQTPIWRWALFIFGICLGLGGILFATGKLIAKTTTDAQKTSAWLAPARPSREALRAIGFTLLFVVIVLWFQVVDPWQTHFARPSRVYRIYYILRLGFAAYMAWLFFFAGHCIVKRLGISARLSGLDRTILSFFAGFALINIAFFLLGIFSAYYKLLALIIAAALVYFSYPVMRELLHDTGNKMVKVYGQYSTPRLLYESTLISMLGLTCLLAAVHQGFSVSGHGYDAVHYVPYFIEALARHGLEPNQYWWHYYISKGAGAAFLSAMLTDLHGIQIVSWLNMVATTLVVWSLVHTVAPKGPWPYLASIVFAITAAVHFPYFIKPHLVFAAFLTMTVWLYARHCTLDGDLKKRFSYIWALIVAAALLQIPVAAAFILPCLAVFALLYWLQKNRTGFAQLTLICGFGASVLVLLLLQNYAATGVMEVTPFKVFFENGNQQKFAEWVSPSVIVNLYEGSRSSTGRLNWDNISNFSLSELSNLFSLPLLSPLLPGMEEGLAIFAALTGVLFLFVRREERFLHVATPIAVLVGWASIVSIVVQQAGSMQRFFTGFYPLLAVLSVATWALLFGAVKSIPVPRHLHSRFSVKAQEGIAAVTVGTVVFGLSLYCIAVNMPTYFAYKNGFPQLNEFYKQMRGRASFQSSLLELNELTDKCVKAQTAAGKGEKIMLVTFVVQMACHYMPDSGIVLGNMGPHLREWHSAAFGPASKAKDVYERHGINHFYLDTSPDIPLFGFGCEIFSPLFAPEAARRHLKVVWRDKNAYLLGWRAPNEPESADDKRLFDAWKVDKKSDAYVMCERVGYYYRTQEGKFPLRIDPALPPIKGWN